jgi:hypothetical protein
MLCNCHSSLPLKASRRPFKGSLVKRASVIGDVIHADLVGPMPPTISGYKYAWSFIDRRTRLKYIYLLKTKSDTGGALRDFFGLCRCARRDGQPLLTEPDPCRRDQEGIEHEQTGPC